MIRFCRHWLLLCMLVASVAGFETVLAESTQQARQRYEQKWLKRERAASNAPERVQLAVDLLNAGVKTRLPHYKMLLLDKAYLWGVRQTESYPIAAHALRQMEQADRSKRLYALDKLAGLYHRLYSSAPNKKLGDGKGLAEVRYRVGQQRLVDLMSDHEEGRLSKLQFLAGLNKVKGDYYQSAKTARRIAANAKRYLSRSRSSRQKQSLSDFIEEVETIEHRVDRGREELAQIQKKYLAGEYGEPGSGAAAGSQEAGPGKASGGTEGDKLASADKSAGGSSTASPGGAAQTGPLSELPEDDSKATTIKGSGKTKRVTHTCTKCRSKYLPEDGGDGGLCYWCQKKAKSIFDLGK